MIQINNIFKPLIRELLSS